MVGFSAPDCFLDPGREVWKQVFSARHEDMCNTPQPPHPDGHIYAIFNKSKFSRLDSVRGPAKPIDTWLDPKYSIDDIFYDRIRPALVLATRFIEMTSEFFNILFFGEFVYGDEIIRYNRHEQFELGSQRFPAMMNDLYNMQFFTGYHEDSRKDSYGTTHYGTYPNDSTPQMATIVVQLNTKFTTFFTHYHYDIFTDEVKNMMKLILAITLVHELVHVWYNFRRMEMARLGDLPLCLAMKKEPYFFGYERSPELGFSWEHFAFRGMPQLNCLGDGPYARAKGLILMPLLQGSDLNGEVAVDSAVVRALLDKHCWDMYERVLIGDLAPAYCSIRELGILERMRTVVALLAFKSKTGRLPSSQELLRAKGAPVPSQAKQQEFAKEDLSISPSAESILSKDAEVAEVTIMMEQGCHCSSPPSPTRFIGECMDYADQWAFFFKKAISDSTYADGRAHRQKRIKRPQR
ncbi:hypothetical protein AYL99_08164 [Fonsecaea erecta]|uniref:Uncharacterized protein n=1 Tax=Fonsecaea erecta TaxID=1367422 RepID=A0A178ZD81_9EURO|nr:hypothetical protein AYL99_08164 [Fonsecaea erecta]OAP57426.1 hypothetical protein AYL99_08164 [Fonsecaea erecta]